jgi:hypothetical protein
VNRTGAVLPGVDLDRRRNDGAVLCRDLNFTNPTERPARVPVRDWEKLASARAASTLAHSNTSAGTSARQARPLLPSSFTVELSAWPFFYALNSLMRDCTDHDNEGVIAAFATPASRSVARISRLVLMAAT